MRLGDPVPEFELYNAFDVKVTLSELLRENVAIVEFIRGTWDPVSRERLQDIAKHKLEFAELGARWIVITCERASTAREYIEKSSEALTLVIDRTRSITRSYGVLQWFSYGAFNVARPSTFLVDSCRFLRWSKVGRSPVDLTPLEEVARHLKTLRNESK